MSFLCCMLTSSVSGSMERNEKFIQNRHACKKKLFVQRNDLNCSLLSYLTHTHEPSYSNIYKLSCKFLYLATGFKRTASKIFTGAAVTSSHKRTVYNHLPRIVWRSESFGKPVEVLRKRHRCYTARCPLYEYALTGPDDVTDRRFNC
jgi:hypothetical protein